ncbi:MAG: glycoside hydrolase family 2 TIM barrel-domain containing protein [Schaedlerella sp.]|nr:glycoside hydrolase family 2 TIM barrel-domain containing protein [Schaedlerella sp.]
MKQLFTRWGRELDKEKVLTEYPRPLMQRESYECLNGYWDYAITKDFCRPFDYDGKILVPFSPECVLSGVERQLMPDEYLWYRVEFGIDEERLNNSNRLIVHFGAVDQTCIIYVNQRAVLEHIGGYLPFELDVTPFLKKSKMSGQFLSVQEIVIAVRDFSDKEYHSRGKQKLERGGMFYTAQSGIWKTVWMEYVPEAYIEEVLTEPSLDNKSVRIVVKSKEQMPVKISVRKPQIYSDLSVLPESAPIIVEAEGESNEPMEIALPEIQPWSCETPYLYYFTVEMEQFFDTEDDTPDKVQSYFALRTFSVEKDEKNLPRICLNHQVQFQRGVLDQGYWPDGLYTAPSDEAMIFDIQSMKDLGFNMIRKHCKIEPQRWYYHCDRLGMVVWQDMVNGGSEYKSWFVTYLATILSWMHIKVKDNKPGLLSRKDKMGQKEFIAEMKETIRVLKGHPSIAAWVIFNEGWGQFRAQELSEIAKMLDPHRLVDQASGWFDQGGGDFNSIHNYFFRLSARKDKRRAFVLSEYGGYALKDEEHSASEKLYGYGTYKDMKKLNLAFKKREQEVQALIPKGLCASIYTQVSDIEDEVNGIFTYDREVLKINPDEILKEEEKAEVVEAEEMPQTTSEDKGEAEDEQ